MAAQSAAGMAGAGTGAAAGTAGGGTAAAILVVAEEADMAEVSFEMPPLLRPACSASVSRLIRERALSRRMALQTSSLSAAMFVQAATGAGMSVVAVGTGGEGMVAGTSGAGTEAAGTEGVATVGTGVVTVATGAVTVATGAVTAGTGAAMGVTVEGAEVPSLSSLAIGTAWSAICTTLPRAASASGAGPGSPEEAAEPKKQATGRCPGGDGCAWPLNNSGQFVRCLNVLLQGVACVCG
jgi:hypothetical protein